MPKTSLLTLAQVCALPPGNKDNPSWIEGGFGALVDAIVIRTLSNGKMWVCQLSDPANDAHAEMAVFMAPKFQEGEWIEVSGQGLRREEFRGKVQVKISQKSDIHVVDGTPPPAPVQPQSEEGASVEPSQPIYGATVGMALNQTLETFRYIYSRDELRDMIKTPHFWAAAHEFASDQIRLARLLGKGRLAPAIKDRMPEDFDSMESPSRAGTQVNHSPKHSIAPKPSTGGNIALDTKHEEAPF